MKCKNTLVAVALALGSGTVHAGLINAGFETGNLTGWTSQPSTVSANVVHTSTSSGAGTSMYTPTEGQWFLKIASGAATQDVWQTVTQSVFLQQGETLTGNAAFDWGDYAPFTDEARVRILGATTTDTLFDMSGASFPVPPYPPSSVQANSPYSDFYNGPWTQWSWTALAAGTYTIEYGVRNTGGQVLDASGSSYGLFDAVRSVPEPASLALFVIGLASLSSMQRRKAYSLYRPS